MGGNLMSKEKSNKPKVAPVDKPLFFGSAGLITILVVLMIVFEEKSGTALQGIFNFLTDQMGAVYLWATIISGFFIAWLAFGKYGNVKLGGPDAQPEFKTGSWLAMFFCSGIGTSLLAWASKEWYYYYVSPPFGLEAQSVAAAEMASSYAIFHWGILGWVIYCIMAFPIGYAYYNRNYNSVRFSTACIGVIGEKNAKGALGKFIDFLLIFGLMGANSTSLASGTPMLAESCSRLLGIEHTFMVDVVVILIWTAIFTTSVTLGLKKGIKVLSDINVVGVLILCSFIFVVGPTWFMINSFTNSMGIMMSDFFRMAFYTDPIGKSMFPQWWTVFYWAWYFAYAPYMGAFIARISKGRSFKEIAMGVILGGSLGCAIFHVIFGGNALYQQLNGLYDFVGVAQSSGDFTAVVGALMNLPGSLFILILFCFVGFIYSATTIDSSAFTMATVASKDMGEDEEPRWWNRMFWAVMLGGLSLVVMNIGGLTPIKTMSLVVAFPILIFVMISLISLSRWLKEDQPHLQKSKSEKAN
jgi:BCCT family betaine/carnitine transporter